MIQRLDRTTASALAILAYLAIALLACRNALSSPTTLLPYPAILNDPDLLGPAFLDHWDQAMVVSTVVRNANLLVSRPWDLLADVGQCYPMPGAHTLGEHMFGVGILAALPYALTRDPLFSYNAAIVLSLWIPAVTMYFLSLRFTRSPGAAFVAGLAFALVPGRLIDPSHPYVHGDLWAPAVLLFLHRLFVSAKWSDALWLALFLNLEVFESLYPLLSTSLTAGVYGIYLLFRHPRAIPRVAPRLALALALAAVGAWVVLGPYLETSATWGLLSGRQPKLLAVGRFLPGGDHFPGYAVLGLIVVGLVDRVRGPRPIHGEDPRVPFLLAGLLVAWSALQYTRIDALGVGLVSPLVFLRGFIPGLEAVRALNAVAIGTGIATSFLAGYGALVLMERLRPVPWGATLGATSCALLLVCMRFVPALADASFGRTFRYATYEARPAQEDIDLLRAAGPGPLIDLPLSSEDDEAKRLDVAHGLLLASYDPRPLAACYNSFRAPANQQVVALAAQLPAPDAVEALGGVGFESIFLSRNRAGPAMTQKFLETRSADPEAARRLPAIGRTASIEAFRVVGTAAITHDYESLRPGPSDDVLTLGPGRSTIGFPIANPDAATFVLPRPLRPSPLVVRWHDESGALALEHTRRALLPIAIGPGGTMSIDVEGPTPDEAGTYVVTLARAEAPERPVGRRRVHILPRP